MLLNGFIRRWRWTATAEYDRVDSSTRTDAGLDVSLLQSAIAERDPSVDPFVAVQPKTLVARLQNASRSRSDEARLELMTTGPVIDLPAGEIAIMIKFGADLRALQGSSRIDELERQRDLARNRVTLQTSVDIPLSSRDHGSMLGNLALNLNAEAEHLSDFGPLTSVGYGFNWSPARGVRILGSIQRDESAPSIQRLSDPVLATPNARVYDLTRHETVEVSRITGGNPQLRSQTRERLKLGLTAHPWATAGPALTAEFVRQHTSNPIRSFPSITPELEAAFPERFQRSLDGRLTSVDARPLNFFRRRSDTIRWGMRFSRTLRAQSPTLRSGAAAKQDGSSSQTVGHPSKTARQQVVQHRWPSTRIQASINHKWRLADEVLVAGHGPTLDFLKGAQVGSGGGRSRHELDARLRLSRSGLTARATGRWRAGSVVGTGAGEQALIFSDLTTFDLSLSANLGRQPVLVRYDWLRDARFTVALRNVFDARLRVRDGAGATPVNYLPDVLDPFGRSVRISFRKLFR